MKGPSPMLHLSNHSVGEVSPSMLVRQGGAAGSTKRHNVGVGEKYLERQEMSRE